MTEGLETTTVILMPVWILITKRHLYTALRPRRHTHTNVAYEFLSLHRITYRSVLAEIVRVR